MKVSTLQRATFKQWQGGVVPDSTQRPFVLSDSVPGDQKWFLLAASLRDTFPSNDAMWLFALAPLYSALFNPLAIVAQFNTPPVRGAVQLSLGGLSANTTEQRNDA